MFWGPVKLVYFWCGCENSLARHPYETSVELNGLDEADGDVGLVSMSCQASGGDSQLHPSVPTMKATMNRDPAKLTSHQ